MITPEIPCQTAISFPKRSTTVPLSINGDSCKTDKSFKTPFLTIYSIIWLTKYIWFSDKLVLMKKLL